MNDKDTSDNPGTTTPDQERGFTYGYVDDQANPFGADAPSPEQDTQTHPVTADTGATPSQPVTPDVSPAAKVLNTSSEANTSDESTAAPTPAHNPWDAPSSRTPVRRRGKAVAKKTAPDGWPVGSFSTYDKAQQAVDLLSDTGDFPVESLSIVGMNLMEVEQVVGRLTWGLVLGRAALSGAWMGLFFGLLISVFNNQVVAPMVLGLGLGVVFGVISAAVPYALTRGERDFASTTQIVAGRYDVICDPANAPRAREIIARARIA